MVSDQKLKRTGPLTLELAPTEDILAEVVRRRRPGQLIVGFAAETNDLLENGRAKLLRKGADAIVVNAVTGDGVGIEADSNAATFLTLTTSIELHEMPKRQLADRILDEIVTLRRPRTLLVELDEQGDEKARQDAVLREAAVLLPAALQEQSDARKRAEALEQTVAPAARSRQLIVE